MIYRRCGRCGKRIPSGTRCDCLKQRHKEYDRYARDKKLKVFYDSVAWIQKRRYVLDRDNGIDVYVFMKTGEVILADTVHHIVPLKDDWSRRLDEENLMSLNHDTHSLIESKYKENKDGMIEELEQMLRDFRSIEW
jgi:5-methylcytosine-specific restriction endonuclease McrA